MIPPHTNGTHTEPQLPLPQYIPSTLFYQYHHFILLSQLFLRPAAGSWSRIVRAATATVKKVSHSNHRTKITSSFRNQSRRHLCFYTSHYISLFIISSIHIHTFNISSFALSPICDPFIHSDDFVGPARPGQLARQTLDLAKSRVSKPLT